VDPRRPGSGHPRGSRGHHLSDIGAKTYGFYPHRESAEIVSSGGQRVEPVALEQFVMWILCFA
jgi:hypothetical protein